MLSAPRQDSSTARSSPTTAVMSPRPISTPFWRAPELTATWWTPQSNETHEGDQRERRNDGQHCAIGPMLGDQCEHERRNRLHHQERAGDAANERAVAAGAEQRQWHGAARDREQAVGHSEQHHEGGRD